MTASNDVPPVTAYELAKDLASSPNSDDSSPADDVPPHDQQDVIDRALTRLPPG